MSRHLPHAWAWQLGLAFHNRVQVCLRESCDWRRRRVGREWHYSPGPRKPYERLQAVPPCVGPAAIQTCKQRGGADPEPAIPEQAENWNPGNSQED